VKEEGSEALNWEVKNTVGATAPEGVDQKMVDQQNKDDKGTWCGMNNHDWKYSQNTVQVLAVHCGPAEPK